MNPPTEHEAGNISQPSTRETGIPAPDPEKPVPLPRGIDAYRIMLWFVPFGFAWATLAAAAWLSQHFNIGEARPMAVAWLMSGAGTFAIGWLEAKLRLYNQAPGIPKLVVNAIAFSLSQVLLGCILLIAVQAIFWAL